jgi:tRNA-dihydrouridine synthase A
MVTQRRRRQPQPPQNNLLLLYPKNIQPLVSLFGTTTPFQQSPTPTPSHKINHHQKYQELMNASTLSLAPMMEYTDRHFRHLVRLISSKTLLYTEMVAANAIARERADAIQRYYDDDISRENHDEDPGPTSSNKKQIPLYEDTYLQRFLRQGQIEPFEGPSVLQLGGSDPKQLYEASVAVMEIMSRGNGSKKLCDYTAINLNCGCPSPKVAGKGCFGAALMDDPHLVADLTQAIHDGCQGQLPVTVKCRIGTDTHVPFRRQLFGYDANEQESYRRLCKFIETVASRGIVTNFIVHARIAVLQKSFSPADNRKIPPLQYNFVQQLVRDYPELTFTLNGGVDSIAQVQEIMQSTPGLNGVMIGRAWAADPWSFAMADELLYNHVTPQNKKNRLQILEEFGKHADFEENNGDPTKIRRFICKAVSPLFTGEKNSKRFRIALDEIARIPKKLQTEGKNANLGPPISELLLSAAHRHLESEVLMRSPEESYELFCLEMKRQKALGMDGRCTSVTEWQAQRKEESNVEADSHEQILASGTG